MNLSSANSTKLRYPLIDAIRGLAVVNMVAFHLCYDIFCVFGLYDGFDTHPAAVIWERFICCTFIAVSGASVNFTRHGYRRGIVVSLCGFLVTAVTVLFMPSEAIWFGVLNLIGCGMLITYALRERFNRPDPVVGMSLSLALYAVLYGLPERYVGFFSLRLAAVPEGLYQRRYLAYLGLPDKGFLSADYFPLIPWIFMFFFGYFLWRFIERRGYQGVFTKSVPVLGVIGRRSLLIYLIHQPVLYGICLLIFGRI